MFALDAPSYTFAQWIFIKLMAFSYFIAFWSLSVQVLGLFGSKGIIPITKSIENLRGIGATKLFLKMPTLFLWNSSDFVIKAGTYLGMALSLLIILGLFPPLLFFLIWLIYLSYFQLGNPFLSFQWDVLLLETGFIAIFFSMMTPPPTLLLGALWFFTFRFMFSSGFVKLSSKCPEWASLKAMDYHYETQPIPNRIAYYMHQLPKIFAKISTIAVLFIELVVPFFIFGPAEVRYAACIILILLQIFIILTGNYAFFNGLSIALCLTLLSNDQYHLAYETQQASNQIALLFLNIIGAFFIILNALQFSTLFFQNRALFNFLRFFSQYLIINSYGLFARMTTKRYEIVVEGSLDGEEWLAYEFKWKPGDVMVAPKQVAPHQPRLDWQMWFAALSNYQQNPWFINFLVRLLDGSPEVTQLLKTNPFSDKPPKYVRAHFYLYHFSDLKTKEETGQWWVRKFMGSYSPVFNLRDGHEQ